MGAEVDCGGESEGRGRARRIRNCQRYTRGQVLAELPEIVAAIVAQAKKGSATHVRLLLKMSGLDRELKVLPVQAKGSGPRSGGMRELLIAEMLRYGPELVRRGKGAGPVVSVKEGE
jgi:hypothetical protein